MTENKNDFNSTLLEGNYKNWADIVVKIWKQKLIKNNVSLYRDKRKISHTTIYSSFQRFVNNESGGDAKKIDFLFKEYGIFVDMGVGRETSIGNSGNLKEYATEKAANGKSRIKRKRKYWYSKTIWYELKKLQDYLKLKLGDEAAKAILARIPDTILGSVGGNIDQKHKRYQEKNNNRSMRNYYKRNSENL